MKNYQITHICVNLHRLTRFDEGGGDLMLNKVVCPAERIVVKTLVLGERKVDEAMRTTRHNHRAILFTLFSVEG